MAKITEASMRRYLIGFAASILLAGCQSTAPDQPPPLSTWVELTANDQMDVRAITMAPACPAIEVDGRHVAMAERAAPDAAFPVRTCDASLPRSAKSATLNGRALPLVPQKINRIVIFGDTGCRLKGADVQACNDPKAWPYAQVARQAAARHPDLVIHVGDYHYRETPCPAGMAGCAGTPAGDNWGVWSADFFEPAAPLLQAAPWVTVRGNHEICGRGGKGWFRFLDPSPTVLDCPPFTQPYAIRLGRQSLLVFDSASADDNKATPELVRQFADAFAATAASINEPFWLLTHRPVWGLAPAGGKNLPINRTEQAAIDPRLPLNLDMVVSGHVHTFASFAFGEARPAQLVAGVGGSLYDKLTIPAGDQVEIDGMKTTKAFALTEYGYLVMDRTDRGWPGTLYAAGDDRALANCDFQGRDIACH
jgi:hypothetical protein